ncbi:MAG: phenylalanine--tRNA ligase subunit beta [Candidatus Peregrinibacteria bacterium]|nr:phenylalanine--tRNA ligase subunit beta [Candidatus Peregrinibacteria bacterium]MDZ4244637.1 phenylalanine--tRNA ligase subunit beta [Candidatus Gracilibacteria bacterium]
MKLSLNWIKKFVDLPESDAKELGNLLTLRTAEVESVENEAELFENMYIAEVTKIEKHPDADKLSVCELSVGKEKRTLVCGGQNLKEGMLIAYADKGSKVKWHGEGELVKIEYAKVRGILSEGMICAGEEIGLECDNPEGQKFVRIKDLSDTKAKPGTPLAKALNKDDIIFEIDNKSLTHRPDLWGHYGFAREFAAIMKKPLKALDEKFDFPKDKSPLKINSKDKKACPYFGGAIITNVKIEESPQWIKSLLQAAGVRPVNNIVDITNYVMLELGQPMHAYDRSFVAEDFLEARFAKKGEKLETLDHKERELLDTDLVIANSKKVLGLAGVMGGVNSEIKDETTEIILEAANFDAVTVRRTSTYHGLRTDAVQRFEKSLDPLFAKQALIRACQLINELCPNAKFEGGLIEFDEYKVPNIEIKLDPSIVKKVIGADIDEKEMIDSLTRLGFTVKKGKVLNVKVPSWRATKDVDIAEDLIEEIARMHGYENIEASLPPLPILPPRDFPERAQKHIARKILALGLNCSEILSYSFYSEKDVNFCMLDEARHLRVDNYLSEDQTHMRVTLVPNMLKAVYLNLKYQDAVRIFEFGRTYIENGYMPIEEKYLCAMFAEKGKKKKSGPLDELFYDAKGALETFLKKLGAEKYQLVKTSNPPAYSHPNKCLEIKYRGKSIGHVFTLHPIVAKKYQIETPPAIFEVNFSQIIASGLDEISYKALSKLPSLSFDISVVLDEKTETSEVEKTIRNQGGKLIKQIELFDIYQGSNLPNGKKSLAFKILMHSDERTLTDTDMADIQKKIFDQLIKQGGEIRGL